MSGIEGGYDGKTPRIDWPNKPITRCFGCGREPDDLLRLTRVVIRASILISNAEFDGDISVVDTADLKDLSAALTELEESGIGN